MKQNLNINIGWLHGQWGPINQLSIPISDRGVKLGDGIFETILIYKGSAQLLKSHLMRWQQSASILQMAAPPSEQWLRPLINEAIQRISLDKSNGALRLNWTRGNNLSRGISISNKKIAKSDHRFWLELHACEPSFDSISTMISHSEQRNANSQLNQFKTFAFGQAIQAKYEANNCGYDDALLLSSNGDLCCGTTANLLIKRNHQWITPPLDSGCLPGIMRQQGINSGLIKEARVSRNPQQGDEWLLINSLGCKAIRKINNQSLSISTNTQKLWLDLLREE